MTPPPAVWPKDPAATAQLLHRVTRDKISRCFICTDWRLTILASRAAIGRERNFGLAGIVQSEPGGGLASQVPSELLE